MQSHYAEVFANLPMTPAALSDDVASDAAQRWFSTAELKSLNASQSVDFVFITELYMMQEIIKAVRFIAMWLTLFSGALSVYNILLL